MRRGLYGIYPDVMVPAEETQRPVLGVLVCHDLTAEASPMSFDAEPSYLSVHKITQFGSL